MTERPENLRTRIVVPVVVCITALLAAGVLSTRHSLHESVDEGFQTQLSGTQRLLDGLLDAEAKFMSGQIERLAEDRELQDAWLARDSIALLRRAKPILESLRASYRVTHFYFIDPDKVCFLRVHHPEKRGDTLSRFTLDSAVRAGKPVHGIELGNLGTFTLREVHPWRIRGEVKGYLELGMEIGHLTPQLRNCLGVELLFAVDKARLDRPQWEEGLAMLGKQGDWDEFADFVIADSTLGSAPAGFSGTLSAARRGQERGLADIQVGDLTYRMGALPLADAGGRQVGRLAVLQDVTRDRARVGRWTVALLAASVLVGGALWLFFLRLVGGIQQRLVAADRALRKEIAEREGAQQALQEAHDSLEERVHERTAELRDSQAFQERIIESSKDCIKVLDLDGRLLFMSPGGQELLEIEDLSALLNTCWADFWKGDHHQAAVEAVSTAREGGTGSFQGFRPTTRGTPKWWDVVVTPITGPRGRVERLLVVLRDITSQKQAEEERWTLEAQLRQNQKLQSLGTLAGGVAHEINNPLNGIMNYAQLILDRGGPDGSGAEYATEIIAESERVAWIVRNLLTFSRHEKEEHSPASVADLIEATLSLIRAVISHDQIALEVEVSGDLPKVRCRSQQIQQVLMNLMTNARDALNARYPGHDRDKILRVSAGRLDRDGVPCVRVTVEDHGAGIPFGVQERLFEPFFTTKDRARESGLGLAVSHGIVQDHGGELHVECEPGQYTRFHLDLPAVSNP